MFLGCFFLHFGGALTDYQPSYADKDVVPNLDIVYVGVKQSDCMFGD